MAYSTIKRIGISIPDPILKELQELVPERKRSKYIVSAVEEKLESEKKKRLCDEMIKGYKANAVTDAAMAEEWRLLEEETEKSVEIREPKHKPYRRK
jgi:metal-responsive CopG/Arc/MetJ family transcriptional regulator